MAEGRLVAVQEGETEREEGVPRASGRFSGSGSTRVAAALPFAQIYMCQSSSNRIE